MERYVTRRRFNDFGQYRKQLRAWNTDAVQVSRGVLSVQADSLDVGDLIVTHLTLDRDTVFKTTLRTGWYGFVMSITPKRWCGIDIPPGSFYAVGPERETNGTSHGAWDSISVTVRRETLAGWETPFADLLERDPVSEQAIFSCDPDAVARFRRWVEALFDTALPSCAEDESAIWIAAIRERLRRHLVDVLGSRTNPRSASTVQRVARYDLALAALRMIQPEVEPRLTVTDLAHGLGVSARALEYAFHSVLGMSPAQYILAERLNKARHHLMTDGRAGASVTAVAFDHQFENLSRFAHQYARLFGERPSDTLRSARTNFQYA